MSTHDILDTIEAFHQINFNYFSVPPLSIKTKPVLFILRRREDYRDFLKNITATVLYTIEDSEEQSDVSDIHSSPVKQIEAIKTEVLKEDPNVIQKLVSKEAAVRLEEEKPMIDSQKIESVEASNETVLSASNDNQQKKSIKKSIRKLISKYRRTKTDKADSRGLSDSDPTAKKVSIKQLIQQEKVNIEKEELQKIQQQVISLIENNPNIINKDIIKEKLETTVMEELTSAIESDVFKQLKPNKGYKKRTESLTASEDKKTSTEKDKTFDLGASLRGMKLKADTLKFGSREDTLKSGEREKHEAVQENAVDIYEGPDINTDQQIYEDTPVIAEDVETTAETDLFIEEDIEEKLQLASAQIENLMTIISEIVDTMEVTDEDEGSR